MDKDQVAEILVSIATLLELKGENPFKTRAYHNAARALETLPESLDKVIAEERLAEIKGIGESTAKKICELVTTGKLQYYEDLKAATPPGLVASAMLSGGSGTNPVSAAKRGALICSSEIRSAGGSLPRSCLERA